MVIKTIEYSAKFNHYTVVATDPDADPTGYGLGRHGWVSVRIAPDADDERWRQIEEWVRTSYTLVAPKRLAKLVDP